MTYKDYLDRVSKELLKLRYRHACLTPITGYSQTTTHLNFVQTFLFHLNRLSQLGLLADRCLRFVHNLAIHVISHFITNNMY